jgi:hypothetical protein
MWVSSLILMLAATSLDRMSKEDQKETGIYKLNQKEKKALQIWVEANYGAQGSAAPSAVPIKPSTKAQRKPTIEENLQGGRYLRLSDRTMWEIHPDDRNLVQGWLGPSEIDVAPSTNPEYSHTLTNVLTGTTIRARQVSEIPKAPSPQQQPARGAKVVTPQSSSVPAKKS